MILKTYKDFEINVGVSGTFSAEGIESVFDTHDAIIDAIDKASKIKYKPIAGFHIDRNQIHKLTITRPASVGYSGNARFWVKHESGRREVLGRLIADTPENRILIKKLTEVMSEITAASSHKSELEAKLTSQLIVLETM